MITYLKGSPLDWFQTELSQALSGYIPPPAWYSSVVGFTQELYRCFGPRDPIMDTTVAIENLRYRDSGKAVKYSLEFNRHARKTGWNDTALVRQYYKGLPDRLKDEIARVGKPADLIQLQNLVQVLDQRYWERQSEISRDKRYASPSAPAKAAPSAKSAADASAKKSSVAPHLGPDGRLTAAERSRRFDNNLCLGCGDPAHRVPDCPVVGKKRFRTAKGKATTVETPAPATASQQPKE